MGCNGSKDEAPKPQPAPTAASTPLPHKFSNFYMLLTGDEDKLGEGQFAIVRKGVSRATGQVVAVKCIELARLTKEDEDALVIEVEVMRRVRQR
jgi:hypothetical protein